jgi:hypothetical protein
MASPVSFGDVVAMAKLAKTIALAFTKGRRSAPAEFREVESQLYSLSTALAAFQDVTQKSAAELSSLTTSQQGGDQTVANMLSNCNETLKHLEKIVEKYGRIAEQQDPSKTRLQRWSQELIKNYKKIAWTTESGDLATLRSQLMVHTNSLDLVLGIIIKFVPGMPFERRFTFLTTDACSSRTSRIEDSLRQNSDKLSEIHAWWEQNLKNSAARTSETEAAPTPRVVTFEVYLEAGKNLQLMCPKSSLCDDWKESGSSLFSCRCRSILGGREPEHRAVERIGRMFPNGLGILLTDM